MKRLTASVLAAALVLLSPGLPCYQALAATLEGSGGTGKTPGVFHGAPKIEKLSVPIAAHHVDNFKTIPGPVSAAGPHHAGAAKPKAAGEAPKDGEGLTAAEGKSAPMAAGPEIESLADPKTGESARAEFYDRFHGLAAEDAAPTPGREHGEKSGLTPAGEKGRHAPQTVPSPPVSAAQKVKAALHLSEFNSSELYYLSAESLFYLALSVYLASLPHMIHALTGDGNMIGAARAYHYWTMAGAALFAGTVAQKAPMKGLLGFSAVSRTLIFGTIGLTALYGKLGWHGFIALVMGNALVISVHSLLNLEADGAAGVFGSDKKDAKENELETERKIAKANYLYSTISSVLMMVVPPLVGARLDVLTQSHTLAFAAGAGYLMVAGLMALVVVLYSRVEPLEKKIGDGLKASLSDLKPYLRGLWQTRPGRIGLSLVGAGAAALGLWPFLGASAGVAAAALGMAGSLVAFNWDALTLIWGKKVILARGGMATVDAFLDDAVFNVVLPTFAFDILAAGAFGNGLVSAAVTAGRLLASGLLLSRADALERKHGVYGLIAMLTGLAALAFAPSILLWASLPAALAAPASSAAAFLTASLHLPITAGLVVALPAVLLLKFMTVPLRSRMGVLLQTTIKGDPQASAMSKKIFSVLGFFEMIAAGAGGKIFSMILEHGGPGSRLEQVLGANAPMKIVTAALVGFSAVAVLCLPWLKSQLKERGTAEKPEPNPETGALPPPGQAAKPATGEFEALQKLEKNLEAMGLKPYLRATVEEPVSDDRPTVAFVAPASTHKLSIAREGGRQSPGDFLLVLDPSWVIKEKGPDGAQYWRLTKGLYFDKDGQAVLAEYKHPRRARYDANFYTLGANDRTDGVSLERNVGSPMSSSNELEKITNDKLLTRLLLAAKGLAVPATLGFMLAGNPLAARAAELGAPEAEVRAVMLPEEREKVKAGIEEFLKRYQGPQVVVKPSGPQFHSARGVQIFNRDEIEAMVDHVLALSRHKFMPQDGAVLVEERISPPPLYLRTGGHGGPGAFALRGQALSLAILSHSDVAGHLYSPKEMMDLSFRLQVSRLQSLDGAVTEVVFPRAGPWGLPTNAEPENPEDAAGFMKVEDVVKALREQHGLLKTDEEAAAFIEELKTVGEKAFLALAENESQRRRQEGEPSQAQTDYIGLDVMAAYEGGRLIPKIIEINDHDSGGQYQWDLLHPERAGESCREWVAAMFARARRDALKGKRIVLVGAGYANKRAIFEQAHKLGVQVLLVDKHDPDAHWSQGLVAEYLQADTTKREEALAQAKEKLLRSARKNGEIDGLTTFWEDDVTLAARIARDLGFNYFGVESADIVRNKYKSREFLSAQGFAEPREAEANTPEELERAMDEVGFPAVLKPESAAAAMATMKVRNKEEARELFKTLRKQVSTETDSIFTDGTGIVYVQYIEGPEFDLDMEVQGGELVYAKVTDNWPTHEPHFIATGSNSPSLVFSQEQESRIKAEGFARAKALGLNDGVLHFEGRLAKEGPLFFDYNPRMGGHYVGAWNKAVWGRDLVADQLMIAAGIPVGTYAPKSPRTYLAGAFLHPDESGVIKTFKVPEEVRGDPGFFDIEVEKRQGEAIVKGAQRVAMLMARGRTAEEAQRNLKRLQAKIVLVIEPDGKTKP